MYYVEVHLNGFEWLYSWLHGECVATIGEVYSTRAPIHIFGFVYVEVHDLNGFEWLYGWLHGECVATIGEVYSCRAPIHIFGFSGVSVLSWL